MDGREPHRRILVSRSEAARTEARRRRAEASWSAWALEEFARYFYAIALLAVLFFAPLQMADAWLPSGRVPLVSPAVVALLAFAFDTAALYLGIWGYQILWREGGVVDRAITRRRGGRVR